jgi:hypothetical protein
MMLRKCTRTLAWRRTNPCRICFPRTPQRDGNSIDYLFHAIRRGRSRRTGPNIGARRGATNRPNVCPHCACHRPGLLNLQAPSRAGVAAMPAAALVSSTPSRESAATVSACILASSTWASGEPTGRADVQREAAGAEVRGATGRGELPRLKARRIAKERKG